MTVPDRFAADPSIPMSSSRSGRSFASGLRVGAWLVCALIACPAFAEEKSKEYPKVDAALAPVIEAMVAGKSSGPAPIPWRLFVPEGAKPGDAGKFPLIFFLHGAGMRGDDNVGPMYLAHTFWKEKQAEFPCFVLAPQCPKGDTWAPTPFAVEGERARGNYSADKEPRPPMREALGVLDEVIARWPVDEKRIYVMGMSMGGYGTWEALLRRPERWAAAVPICGGGDPAGVSAFKDIPIWVWHGAKDTTVTVETSRAMVAALKNAGGTPRYTELEKVGHGSWVPTFAVPELYTWLFAQKRP